MKASGETKLLAILGAIVLLGAGALFLLGNPGASPMTGKPTPLPSVQIGASAFDALVKDARHVKEEPGAEITVVEFADFECPSCRRTYQGYLGKLLADPKRPVKLIFRHFPLEKEHQFAVPAGIGAEAAARQGKFWEMYKQLFSRVPEEPLDADKIAESAKAVGLDMAQYAKDVADPALKQMVMDDEKRAETNQIMYTPTFLIRDKSGKITSAVGNDGLKTAMDTLFGGEPTPSGSPAGAKPEATSSSAAPPGGLPVAPAPGVPPAPPAPKLP